MLDFTQNHNFAHALHVMHVTNIMSDDQVPSLQRQLLGSSVQLAQRHFVPGPNMWARVNLGLQVRVHSFSD